MILPGPKILSQNLLRNLPSIPHQLQPCSVDLTLRKISQYTTPATIDLANTHRRAAKAAPLPFKHTSILPLNHTSPSIPPSSPSSIHLPPGAYLLDFNEKVDVPLKYMARLYPRSSLWRSGVSIQAGIIDAGYQGSLGALLDVKNPHGVVLYKNARLAQIVFEEMDEEVGEGYRGVYQGSTDSAGRDGVGNGKA